MKPDHAAAACGLLCMLQGCSPGAAPAEGAAAADLSERCEAAVAAAEATPLRPVPWTYSADLTIGDETRPLGSVVGAAWDAAEQRLYVLDGINQRVAYYGAGGEFAGSFGRRGNGPGEFDELGGAHGSRPVYNQLALLGSGHLAVNDLRLLHVFQEDGRFVARLGTSGAQGGPHAVRHVAAISDTSVLFAESGAMRLDTADPQVRAGLRLVELVFREGGVDTAEWGSMRNTLSRFPPFEGMPPRDPYGAYFRRTWDAGPSGLLVIPSQQDHGVCFFDGPGAAPRAFRVAAPLLRVDQAERSRIRDELQEKMGATVPIVGGSWDDFYTVWPETAPPALDVALAPDGVAWVERLLPDRRRAVDLYHAARGYLGSMEPLGPRLPLAFTSECAFVVDEEIPARVEGGNFFYGLRRWCRGGHDAAALAAGRPPPPGTVP